MKAQKLFRRIALGTFLTITLGAGAAATFSTAAQAAPADTPVYHTAGNTIWD